jgi:hypothetical protein
MLLRALISVYWFDRYDSNGELNEKHSFTLALLGLVLTPKHVPMIEVVGK